MKARKKLDSILLCTYVVFVALSGYAFIILSNTALAEKFAWAGAAVMTLYAILYLSRWADAPHQGGFV